MSKEIVFELNIPIPLSPLDIGLEDSMLDDDIHYLQKQRNWVSCLDYDPSAERLSINGDKSNAGVESSKGLGTWRFDKRARKRKYCDLSGKEHTGPEAFVQARKDKDSKSNQTRLTRAELAVAMKAVDYSRARAGHARCSLASWGVPPDVVTKYAQKGVKQLFDWQIECLCVDSGAVLDGGSLIYSAPTSGGKTLVAELLMLRSVAIRGGVVLFVVPFVALADEKTEWFREIWSSLPLGVRAFHGDSEGAEVTSDLDIAVCTIERANIILSQLLESGQQSLLKMVVIDELHMLVDPSRGYLVEVLLSKIKYLLPCVQVVGLSATLPRMADLKVWQHASLYSTAYRPVDLQVRIVKDGVVYKSRANFAKSQMLPHSSTSDTESTVSSVLPSLLPQKVPSQLTFDAVFESDYAVPQLDRTKATCSLVESVIALCMQTMAIGKSVIVFCPSKKQCESIASKLAVALQANTAASVSVGFTSSATAHEPAKAAGSKNLRSPPLAPSTKSDNDPSLLVRRAMVLEELRQTPSSLCPTLRESVPKGVSYHHAGLAHMERNIIQAAFSSGTLSVLCATSTLATGVNLPAHRVIIASPRMGTQYLSVETFRQMCGRAGRLGLDTSGEAMLVLDSKITADEESAVRLMTQEQRPLVSRLHEADGGGLEKLLLEMCFIANQIKTAGLSAAHPVLPLGNTTGSVPLQEQSGLSMLSDKPRSSIQCCSSSQIDQFVSCTLMSAQHSKNDVEAWTRAALRRLLGYGLITKRVIGSEAVFKAHVPCLGDNYETNQLSRAAVLSGMSPTEAAAAIFPLKQAMDGLVLVGMLHLLYLVTPNTSTMAVPWTAYADVYKQNCSRDAATEMIARKVGVDEGRLEKYRFNPPSRTCDSETVKLDRRFFLAMALEALTLECTPVWLDSLMTVSRGQFTSFQNDAAHLCRKTITFCKELKWDHLAAALSSISSRLSYGVSDDLLPLVRMGSAMPGVRARAFFKAGLTSPQAIIEAGIGRVSEVLEAAMPYSGRGGLVACSVAAKVSGVSKHTGDSNPSIKAVGNVPMPVKIPAPNAAVDKSTTVDPERARRFAACERLARVITVRAAEYLKEELRLDGDIRASILQGLETAGSVSQGDE